MKSDLDRPYCRVCSQELSSLGNSLRMDGLNTTTYGWCERCNNYQWSHPWFTEKSTKEIIKDQYR